MLQLMRAEAVRTMQLTGTSTIGELRGRVRLG
jgi:isopentenyl diphosphate isomerase/L-lactate dehydrogenase-like FMN-dependent dehydrogenase